MLRPVIMIGCGGSGHKTIRYVRDAVKRHLDHQGWEGKFPDAWQFIGIDCPTTEAVSPVVPSIPYLPSNDYLSVSLAYGTYFGLNQAIEAKFNGEKNPTAFHELSGWRPNPSHVMVPLRDGAGQLRAVGRSAGVLALQANVTDRLRYAFTLCSAGGPELAEVSRKLGVDVPPGTVAPDPLTIIVGSMAGGTGAGIMLDVVDLVRRTDLKGAFPVLVAFTPDIFGSIQTKAMTANAAAFMSEMLSAYWDDEASDSALIPATLAVSTRGPHSIFLIGRTNVDGLDLLDSRNVYRAVGETLAAITTSTTLQTTIHNFITVCWPSDASVNAGGYGFSASALKGVASSFGSSTISIGRYHFRLYLKKLLHRAILEHLATGCENVATAVLGDAAESMADSAKIAELARRNFDQFVSECGLRESIDGAKQISDQFVSSEIMRARLGQVSNKIKAPFGAGMQQGTAVWWQTLDAQAKQVRVAELATVEADLRKELRDWGSDLYRRILRTTTEFAGAKSIPVVLNLLQSTRAQLIQTSAKFRERAKEASGLGDKAREKARGHLAAKSGGSVPMSAGPVQETVSDLSKGIVFDWSASVYERLSLATESIASALLSGLEASLNQSLSRIGMLTKSQDGQPALVADWPKNDGIVPTSFAPSPVEFYLEPYETWPELAKTLISKSLGDTAGLPIDPIDAARVLIIRGGFGGDGKGRSEESPLIWGESQGGEVVWEPGQQIQTVIADDVEVLGSRIDSWLMRPNMELSNALLDDLGAYLMPANPKTGVAIADHQERLSMFRQKLTSALMQSRPLIEIDRTMSAEVHPESLRFELSVQGFPFGDGHPAREITSQVIQGFLNTAEPVDWAFSDNEAESVLITSFLRYPVNPSVVTSFTKPLNKAVGEYSPDLLRSSFWLWRRARILENFIPLPDNLRLAAIRGFAISRIFGTMTALPTSQSTTANQISTRRGVFNFPPHLLTETDKNNILPSLLEAMILAFADAPARGKAAFDAYGALIEYGTGGGTAAGFEIDGFAAQVLKTGDYGDVKILDAARAETMRGDQAARFQAAQNYITGNINRYDAISSRPMHPHSWRDKSGAVDPVDTLTRELLKDLRSGHVMVREALERYEKTLSAVTSGGVE